MKNFINSKSAFLDNKSLNINDFKDMLSPKMSLVNYPLALEINSEVVIYEGKKIKNIIDKPQNCLAYKNEMNNVLLNGSGVFVVRDLMDADIVDRHNNVLAKIIDSEKDIAKGDHFAKAQTNIRVWNSIQKVAIEDPEAFIEYYKNPLLRLISEAWLGPWYQITAQLNIVKPGGKAQNAHRDYHLGFQEDDIVKQFPLSVQIASQTLTLQGAIAHSDMPITSGPTQLLPYSQKYDLGYLAWRNPEFIEYFNKNFVQLALNKGDALFFNPALFHAAGNNKTNNLRSANLLQISLSFGKTMEKLDYGAMTNKVFPKLKKLFQQGKINALERDCCAQCITDAYFFPNDLDKDMPKYGLAGLSDYQELIDSF